MSAHSETCVCKFGPKSIALISCLCWSLMASRSSKSCSEPTSESISKSVLSDSKAFRSLSSSLSISLDCFVNIVSFSLSCYGTIMLIVVSWAIEFLGIIVNMNNFCGSNSELSWSSLSMLLCLVLHIVINGFSLWFIWIPNVTIVYCLFDVSAVTNTTIMYIIKGRITIVYVSYQGYQLIQLPGCFDHQSQVQGHVQSQV